MHSVNENSPHIHPQYLPLRDLYARHQKELWAVAFAACRDSNTATTIVQNIFATIQSEREKGHWRSDLHEWMLQMARTLGDGWADEDPRDPAMSPEHANIHDALARLTVGEREVVTLHYALEYDTQRIADLLSLKKERVQQIIATARQSLGTHCKMQNILPTAA